MASISILKACTGLYHFLDRYFTCSFHLYTVNVDDRIVFMLTYEIASFCVFLVCLWSALSRLIQDMRNSAPSI